MLRPLATLTVAVFVMLPAVAQAQAARALSRSATDGLTLPPTSPALSDEATAPAVNPGGLGFYRGSQLGYLHQGFGAGAGDVLMGDGFFLAQNAGPLVLGYGIEWLRPNVCTPTAPCFRKQTFAAALGGPHLSLGLSYATFSSEESAAQDALKSWNFGLTWRPWSFLSFGWSMLDANRPSDPSGFGRLPVRYASSIGLRFPGSDRFEFSIDEIHDRASANLGCLFTGCDDGVNHVIWGGSLKARLVNGVSLLAGGAHDLRSGASNFQIGLALDTARFGVTYASTVSRDGAAASPQTLAVRLSREAYAGLSLSATSVEIDLNKELSPPSRGLVASAILPAERTDPLGELITRLSELADDPHLRVVIFKSSGVPLGMGRAEELREALEGLHAHGKKLVAYLVSGGDLDYYLAVAADRILVAPQAQLLINGFSATAFFAAETLSKIGVRAQAVRVGAYKNAPDMFTRNEMSKEQREVDDALLDDMYGRYVAAISRARGVKEEDVRAMLDKGLVTGAELKAKGLIDDIVYPDEIEEAANRLVGDGVHLAKRSLDSEVRDTRWGERPRIAVIRVEGTIVGGKSSASPLGGVVTSGAETIVAQIRAAAEDHNVRAIVLRIDSPGGDGLASDLIWRALKEAQNEHHKPCVASMGDVAASGGYYVAAGCEEIVAEPSTITGSIGVFALKFDAQDLLGKIGLREEVIRRGKHADLFTLTRPWDNEELATVQGWIDGFYDQFLTRVADGRAMKKEDVDKLARGRVWSGKQAQELRLVDKLGSFATAVNDAAQKAGLAPDADLELFEPDGSMEDGGLLEMEAAILAKALPRAQGETKAAFEALTRVAILGDGRVQAAMPYTLDIQ